MSGNKESDNFRQDGEACGAAEQADRCRRLARATYDRSTAAMLEDVKVFNPNTATWEAPGPEDAYRVEEHKAQVKGEPAPGDRTAEDMARLEAEGGGVPVMPVQTAAGSNEPAGSERTTQTGGDVV